MSPLTARTLRRANTGSGLSVSCAVSATCPLTSWRTDAERATSRVDPALIMTPLGMLLVERKSGSDIPTRLAASAGFMFAGARQAVQVESCEFPCASRLALKIAALSHGNRIWGVPAASITGRLSEGLSALKSSSFTSASLAVSATSMSRVMATSWK